MAVFFQDYIEGEKYVSSSGILEVSEILKQFHFPIRVLKCMQGKWLRTCKKKASSHMQMRVLHEDQNDSLKENIYLAEAHIQIDQA